MKENDKYFNRDGSYTPKKARAVISDIYDLTEHINPDKITRRDTENLRAVRILLANIKSRHDGYIYREKE